MPKYPTFPTLYEDLKKVSISFLTKHGYLKPNQNKSGTINWSRYGNKTGSISIRVSTEPESPNLELSYKYNEAPINYRVQLVSAPSNLGKGVVWYFICPHTGKRCRKLYWGDKYFYHRSAIRGGIYKKQLQSKGERDLYKTFELFFLSEELDKKHFKTHYAGKPTKKYLKLIEKIHSAENNLNNAIKQA